MQFPRRNCLQTNYKDAHLACGLRDCGHCGVGAAGTALRVRGTSKGRRQHLTVKSRSGETHYPEAADYVRVAAMVKARSRRQGRARSSALTACRSRTGSQKAIASHFMAAHQGLSRSFCPWIASQAHDATPTSPKVPGSDGQTSRSNTVRREKVSCAQHADRGQLPAQRTTSAGAQFIIMAAQKQRTARCWPAINVGATARRAE